MSLISNIVSDFSHKLELTSDFSIYDIRVWGNDIYDNFTQKIEYTNFHERFNYFNNQSQTSRTIYLVVGAININTLARLKESLKFASDEAKLIYAPGLAGNQLLKNSYSVVTDLAEHIKVDYIYYNFPYDLTEIISTIENSRSQIYE